MNHLVPFWLKPHVEPSGFQVEGALLELLPGVVGNTTSKGKETSHYGVTAGTGYARHERKLGGRVRVAEFL